MSNAYFYRAPTSIGGGRLLEYIVSNCFSVDNRTIGDLWLTLNCAPVVGNVITTVFATGVCLGCMLSSVCCASVW